MRGLYPRSGLGGRRAAAPGRNCRRPGRRIGGNSCQSWRGNCSDLAGRPVARPSLRRKPESRLTRTHFRRSSGSGFTGLKDFQDWMFSATGRLQSCEPPNPANPGSDVPCRKLGTREWNAQMMPVLFQRADDGSRLFRVPRSRGSVRESERWYFVPVINLHGEK